MKVSEAGDKAGQREITGVEEGEGELVNGWPH